MQLHHATSQYFWLVDLLCEAFPGYGEKYVVICLASCLLMNWLS